MLNVDLASLDRNSVSDYSYLPVKYCVLNTFSFFRENSSQS